MNRQSLFTAIIRKSVSRVEIKRVAFAPGQAGPKHLHSCPVLGYVLSGSVLMQVKGEAKKILIAGEAFYEPANHVILHFDNASHTEPASFVAFYLLGDDDSEHITFLEGT